MTVADLISELEKYDPNQDVWITVLMSSCPVAQVDEWENAVILS